LVCLTTLPATALAPILTSGAASDTFLDARLTALGNPTFYDSSYAVVPGSTVSLHWGASSTAPLDSGVHVLITSSLPGFSSASVVQWPSDLQSPPQWNGTGWVTTATAMSVSIPSDAAPGTSYQVGIEACTDTKCITPPRTMTLDVPSPTTWATKPYQADFSGVATFPTPGQPFATTFMASNDSIWSASEFSHVITEIAPTGRAATVLPVSVPRGAPSAFRKPFANCDATTCQPSSTSALSEQVTTSNNGWAWTTFGGWRVYSNSVRDVGGLDPADRASAPRGQGNPPNRSEVVAFDPVTTRSCTYLVPGNNTQVAGIAAIGAPPHTQIWFVASYGPSGRGSLDEFDPATVGGGCNGRTDQAYVLPPSVVRLSWPKSGAQWPVQIAADPSSPTLWISNFYPYAANGTVYSGIDRVDVSNPAHPRFVRRYLYPAANHYTFFGAKPWDIVAPPNSDYVYATDNGDAEIVRINKVTNQLQEVPIPLTTDLENAFGLAISSGRLYFALADDFDPHQYSFGRASTFGYIDLSSWPDDGPPTSGVIYTGLNPVTDPVTAPDAWANYRAIAVGPTGQVALTDKFGVVRLTP
jgi:hypothetical protein